MESKNLLLLIGFESFQPALFIIKLYKPIRSNRQYFIPMFLPLNSSVKVLSKNYIRRYLKKIFRIKIITTQIIQYLKVLIFLLLQLLRKSNAQSFSCDLFDVLDIFVCDTFYKLFCGIS